MPLVVKHEGTNCNLDFQQIIQMSLVPISRALNPFMGVRTPVEEDMRVLTSIEKKNIYFLLYPNIVGFHRYTTKG